MSRWRQWLPPLAVLLLLAGAFAWLFQVRLGGGDVYPEYSSLRADALGTRAFYEALGRVPGMNVTRDYHPLAELKAQPRLIVLAGQYWEGWSSVPADELAALNAAVANGARLVLAFRAAQPTQLELGDKVQNLKAEAREREKQAKETKEETKARKEKEEKEAKKRKLQARHPGRKIRVFEELGKAWGVDLKIRWLMDRPFGKALREKGTSPDLPTELTWRSNLYFPINDGADWRVIYRRAGEPVLIEKTAGRGSIVLLADSYVLSNEAMQRDRATPLLAWLVGGQHDVIFPEGRLGVLEENGIGFLARRYGLGGALLLCVLLGLLYAWRRLVAFVPPAEDFTPGGELALSYEPAAGFTGLLRRSLDVAAVLPACVEEWRKGRRGSRTGPGADARVEAAWRARDPKAPLTETYNALVRALKPR